MATEPDDEEDEYGKHFGRADLDRVGFFDDAPPGPWDGFRNRALGGGLREGASSGKQISCTRVGGMFDRQVKRLFIGEADKDDVPPPKEGKEDKDEEEKTVKPIIQPPGYPKKHSTPGDYYGCFGKRLKHFSPETRDEPPREPLPPNFKTSPTPFGGPGYANYCLNRYVKMYKGYEPYDPEDPPPKDESADAKRPKIFMTTILPRPYFTDDEDVYGPSPMPPSKKPLVRVKKPPQMRFFLTFPRAPNGPNSGCFHPFPRHWPDPYEPVPKKKIKKVKPKVPLHLIGDPGFKSKFTDSIVDRVTRVACNAVNYTDYREQVYPLR